MKKAKVLLLVDVVGWAWWHKANAIKSRLDDYEFDIWVTVDDPRVPRDIGNFYDLLLAFGPSIMPHISFVPRHKKIVSVTAHLAHRDPVIFKRLIQQATAMCVNSRLLEAEFRGWHDKSFYCPNGVDHRFFYCRPKQPGRKARFSFVAKYCPEKGYDAFVKPASISADVPLTAVLRDYRNCWPPERMREHYWGHDVHVVHSTVDGTPNPALEAAACGLALISNPIGNMPEFITDGLNGFLIEPVVDNYVEKMRFFATNPEEARIMGANARKTIEANWTWDIRARDYQKMFEEVLR